MLIMHADEPMFNIHSDNIIILFCTWGAETWCKMIYYRWDGRTETCIDTGEMPIVKH